MSAEDMVEEDEKMVDDGDDGGDEVGVGQPARKKPKPLGSQFVDDIAEDEDDPEGNDEDLEEEDSLDEEERREAEKASKSSREIVEGALAAEDSSMHLALANELDQKESEQMFKTFEAKYGRQQDHDERMRQITDHMKSGTMEQDILPLPSIRDPKLFLVKCDPGKEHEAVFGLMSKFFRKDSSKNDKVFIKSAFTVPKAKGYIYIEADKEIHVKKALRHVRALKWWNIKLVPIKEMVQAITINLNAPTVKLKQWVRLKRGRYQKDLAQVVNTFDQGTICEVKVVPRIDFAELENEQKAGPEVEKKRGFQKRKRGSVRPLPKLFDAAAISALGGQIITKGGEKLYKGNKYKHGFLYKKIPVASLMIDGVNPTMDEVERFQARMEDDEGKMTDEDKEEPVNMSLPSEAKKKKTFLKGDRIYVTDGDMASLTGRVISVQGETITMKPDHVDVHDQVFQFSISEVKKFFKIGDHVKVIAGKHMNETGMITSVIKNEDAVIIFCDNNFREIKTFAQDILESSEVAAGLDQLGDYQLHNMVQLAGGQVGVIVKVETNSVKVLTNRGQVQTLRLQDIGRRRNSKFSSAIDSGNNSMSVDDIVRVIGGPHKGRQGTVTHIHRSWIFLFNQQSMENSGIFVVLAKHCSVVGSGGRRPQIIPGSPNISHSVGGGGGGGGGHHGHGGYSGGRGHGEDRREGGGRGHGDREHGGHGGGRGRGRGRGRGHHGSSDPLCGKTVQVISGQYKGYIGIVTTVGEVNAQVELHGVQRIVAIAKKALMERDTFSRGGDTGRPHYDGGKTPIVGMATPHWGDDYGQQKTPMYGDGGMTPLHTFNERGDQTPAPQTPSHEDSAKTPSHDVWLPQTPRHTPHTPRTPESPQNDVERDIAEVEGPTTPAMNPITPGIPTPSEHLAPSTPTPQTPATPVERTPVGPVEEEDETITSPAPSPIPQERGVPYTPHTPSTPVSTPVENPMTPHTPMENPRTPVPRSVSEFHWTRGCVVETINGNGVIVLLSGNACRVKLFETKEIQDFSITAITPVKGTDKNQEVIIVSGDQHRGARGVLMGTDPPDGILRIKASEEIVILPLDSLCRFQEP